MAWRGGGRAAAVGDQQLRIDHPSIHPSAVRYTEGEFGEHEAATCTCKRATPFLNTHTPTLHPHPPYLVSCADPLPRPHMHTDQGSRHWRPDGLQGGGSSGELGCGGWAAPAGARLPGHPSIIPIADVPPRRGGAAHRPCYSPQLAAAACAAAARQTAGCQPARRAEQSREEQRGWLLLLRGLHAVQLLYAASTPAVSSLYHPLSLLLTHPPSHSNPPPPPAPALVGARRSAAASAAVAPRPAPAG